MWMWLQVCFTLGLIMRLEEQYYLASRNRLAMGNDPKAQTPLSLPPKHSFPNAQNRIIPIFTFESNTDSPDEESVDGPICLPPQRPSLSAFSASKSLFGKEPPPSTPSLRMEKISYRKFNYKGKDLHQYESSHRGNLKPITFSTFCSIEEMELPRTRDNSFEITAKGEEREIQQQQQEEDPFETVLGFIKKWIPHESAYAISQQDFIRIRKSDIYQEYQFRQKLGAGSFGEVFRCVGKGTGTERAVKVLKRNIFSNPRVKQQFLQEFQVLRRASHPNILRVLQVYHFAGFMYIVTELCPGGTLSDLLRRMRPSVGLMQEILLQLFRGVAYLHSLGIIHRDIKPDNLAFTRHLHEHSSREQVDLRIIDFGLAVEQPASVFKDWAKVGTISYMAPQVFDGLYSIKCDAWACGVVMYQLLAGINPFKQANSLQTRHCIHNFVPDPYCQRWSDLPMDNKHLVLHLLDSSYLSRLKPVDALHAPFFTDAEGEAAVDRQAVAKQIVAYSRGSNLISAVESFLSFTHHPQEDRRMHSHAFQLVNHSHSGLISKAQLSTFLQRELPELTQQQSAYIFRKINKSESGVIDFGEFLNIFVDRKTLFSPLLLADAFDFIDANRNGFLQRDELKYFLKTVPREEIEQLYKEMLPDPEGRLDRQAFISYIQKQLN